ncbi:MAG: hypothetical protein WC518_03165 [Patescibacteria group bacterium]
MGDYKPKTPDKEDELEPGAEGEATEAERKENKEKRKRINRALLRIKTNLSGRKEPEVEEFRAAVDSFNALSDLSDLQAPELDELLAGLEHILDMSDTFKKEGRGGVINKANARWVIDNARSVLGLHLPVVGVEIPPPPAETAEAEIALDQIRAEVNAAKERSGIVEGKTILSSVRAKVEAKPEWAQKIINQEIEIIERFLGFLINKVFSVQALESIGEDIEALRDEFNPLYKELEAVVAELEGLRETHAAFKGEIKGGAPAAESPEIRPEFRDRFLPVFERVLNGRRQEFITIIRAGADDAQEANDMQKTIFFGTVERDVQKETGLEAQSAAEKDLVRQASQNFAEQIEAELDTTGKNGGSIEEKPGSGLKTVRRREMNDRRREKIGAGISMEVESATDSRFVVEDGAKLAIRKAKNCRILLQGNAQCEVGESIDTEIIRKGEEKNEFEAFLEAFKEALDQTREEIVKRMKSERRRIKPEEKDKLEKSILDKTIRATKGWKHAEEPAVLNLVSACAEQIMAEVNGSKDQELKGEGSGESETKFLPAFKKALEETKQRIIQNMTEQEEKVLPKDLVALENTLFRTAANAAGQEARYRPKKESAEEETARGLVRECALQIMNEVAERLGAKQSGREVTADQLKDLPLGTRILVDLGGMKEEGFFDGVEGDRVKIKGKPSDLKPKKILLSLITKIEVLAPAIEQPAPETPKGDEKAEAELSAEQQELQAMLSAILSRAEALGMRQLAAGARGLQDKIETESREHAVQVLVDEIGREYCDAVNGPVFETAKVGYLSGLMQSFGFRLWLVQLGDNINEKYHEVTFTEGPKGRNLKVAAVVTMGFTKPGGEIVRARVTATSEAVETPRPAPVESDAEDKDKKDKERIERVLAVLRGCKPGDKLAGVCTDGSSFIGDFRGLVDTTAGMLLLFEDGRQENTNRIESVEVMRPDDSEAPLGDLSGEVLPPPPPPAPESGENPDEEAERPSPLPEESPAERTERLLEKFRGIKPGSMIRVTYLSATYEEKFLGLVEEGEKPYIRTFNFVDNKAYATWIESVLDVELIAPPLESESAPLDLAEAERLVRELEESGKKPEDELEDESEESTLKSHEEEDDAAPFPPSDKTGEGPIIIETEEDKPTLDQARKAYYQARRERMKLIGKSEFRGKKGEQKLEQLRRSYEATLQESIRSKVQTGELSPLAMFPDRLAQGLVDLYDKENQLVWAEFEGKEKSRGERLKGWWQRHATGRLIVSGALLGAAVALATPAVATSFAASAPLLTAVFFARRILGGTGTAMGVDAALERFTKRFGDKGLAQKIYKEYAKEKRKDPKAAKAWLEKKFGSLSDKDLKEELARITALAERKGKRQVDVFGDRMKPVIDQMYQASLARMEERLTAIDTSGYSLADALSNQLDFYISTSHQAEEQTGRAERRKEIQRGVIAAAAGLVVGIQPWQWLRGHGAATGAAEAGSGGSGAEAPHAGVSPEGQPPAEGAQRVLDAGAPEAAPGGASAEHTPGAAPAEQPTVEGSNPPAEGAPRVPDAGAPEAASGGAPTEHTPGAAPAESATTETAPGPEAPEKLTEFEQALEVVEGVEAKGSHTVWGVIEKKCEAALGSTVKKAIESGQTYPAELGLPKDVDISKMTSEALKKLPVFREGKITYLVDSIKDAVAKSPTEFGLPANIDHVTPEDLAKLAGNDKFNELVASTFFDPKTGDTGKVLQAAGKLSEKTLSQIESNNAYLRQVVGLVKGSGVSLDQSAYDLMGQAHEAGLEPGRAAEILSSGVKGVAKEVVSFYSGNPKVVPGETLNGLVESHGADLAKKVLTFAGGEVAPDSAVGKLISGTEVLNSPNLESWVKLTRLVEAGTAPSKEVAKILSEAGITGQASAAKVTKGVLQFTLAESNIDVRINPAELVMEASHQGGTGEAVSRSAPYAGKNPAAVLKKVIEAVRPLQDKVVTA